MNAHSLPQRAYRAFDRLEKLPPGLRTCVHEFGLEVVEALGQAGVKTPGQVRHIIQNVWLGGRASGDGSTGKGVEAQLDAFLVANGAGIPAAALIRFLWGLGYAVVPHEPHGEGVAVSMLTVTAHETRVTKEEKHRRRLREAIRASARAVFPWLCAP